MTVGIICEYNPFHLGHKKQFDIIRRTYGEDTAIVCGMSGNFVQRGHPAIFDKMTRAEAALGSGADLVVELPIPTCLSSAEGFAAGGVRVLSRLCDVLCFGTESGTKETLMATARALLDDRFPALLRSALDTGISFPAARVKALEAMGADPSLLQSPNDILAVEYCKAILSQSSGLDILPIRREGSYHDQEPDPENPSATALRRLLENAAQIGPFTTQNAHLAFQNQPLATINRGEKPVLYRLKTMVPAEFEALPYGSEGLWRKLMGACRQEHTLEDILNSVKSKRYTRSRLDRMVMCAFLSITAEDLELEAPYCRILAFNDRGRSLLNGVKKEGFFRNIGEETKAPYEALEARADLLYPLFRENPSPLPPRRVLYRQNS